MSVSEKRGNLVPVKLKHFIVSHESMSISAYSPLVFTAVMEPEMTNYGSLMFIGKHSMGPESAGSQYSKYCKLLMPGFSVLSI